MFKVLHDAIVAIRESFGLKGSWKWAVRQMKKGKIVKPEQSRHMRYKFEDGDPEKAKWYSTTREPIWRDTKFLYCKGENKYWLVHKPKNIVAMYESYFPGK